jgi:glycolate oxidase FAD binding subunit
VAERAKRMAELLSAGEGSPEVTVSGTPPPGWGQLPSSAGFGTVVGVSFWVAALHDVLNALATAGALAGVRFAVTGPAGAGLVYAWLDRDCSMNPAADHDAAAARFVTALRERLAAAGGGAGGRGGSAPRGSVTVLAAPGPVRAAAGDYGPVPGVDLMRAVKDQFDPGHRMFPGRLPWGQ